MCSSKERSEMSSPANNFTSMSQRRSCLEVAQPSFAAFYPLLHLARCLHCVRPLTFAVNFAWLHSSRLIFNRTNNENQSQIARGSHAPTARSNPSNLRA